jgi:hypothetical protein
MINNRFVKLSVSIILLTLMYSSITTLSGSGSPDVTPVIDGVVTENEYNSVLSFNDGKFTLYWTNNDTTIIVGMVGQTTGWVAIGFDPSTAMLDADLILGWVDGNGDVSIFDAYSLNAIGADHPPDTTLGGTDDILLFNGSEDSGFTTLEFARLLSTGDENDNPIPSNGSIPIIWAYGSADSFSASHTGRGAATLLTGTASSGTTSTEIQSSSTTSITSSSSNETPGLTFFIGVIAIGSLIVHIQIKKKIERMK